MSDYEMSDYGNDTMFDDEVPDNDDELDASSSTSTAIASNENTADGGSDEEDDDAAAVTDDVVFEPVVDVVTATPRVGHASFTGDVLLPLEIAALEGREACRIDSGADLIHKHTKGSSNALDLARMFINERNPLNRPPYIIVRELPNGTVHNVSLRTVKIARPVCEALPSP